MRENATSDNRDPQARAVWRNHVRELKAKRPALDHQKQCTPRALPQTVTLEQARIRTRLAELSLDQ
jgi:hypothetical protein